MTKTKKAKRIPFDINVALRIKSRELVGSFVKRNGKKSHGYLPML